MVRNARLELLNNPLDLHAFDSLTLWPTQSAHMGPLPHSKADSKR